MPHINDRRGFATCIGLLGGPQHLHYVARLNGRRVVDTTNAGQQQFQALLLWCLISPWRTIHWDSSTGRSFRDMHSYYSWVSPQPDRLASGWSVSARVARYLLPDAGQGEGNQSRYSGIPGLRFAGTGKKRIRLEHLPTGGIIDLYDSGLYSSEMMEDMLFWETSWIDRRKNERPLWQESSMTPLEIACLPDWKLAHHSSLLSAMMSRINILWRHWGSQAELEVNPSTGSLRLTWEAGPNACHFARLLTDSPIEIHGARSTGSGDHDIRIELESSVLELRGPTKRISSSDN